MGKKPKAELKEAALKHKAQVIAEAVVRQRCKEEAMDAEERLELLKQVYEDTLARLRSEKS